MKNLMPKVSVLIPAYNEEKYIVQTLEVLLQQDYPNYEVLVIDNASADRTAEIISSFIYRNSQTVPIRLLHESCQGTQFARECGRRAATGEIIAQLDADCLPPANWITAGVSLLQKKGVVAVAGTYDYFDSHFFIHALTYLSQLFILRPLNSLAQLFKRGGVIIGGNVFIKAAVLEATGGYDTSLSFYGDDVDIALKLSRHGKIVFTKKIVVKSSSRRYTACGFFKVQSKYSRAFFQSIFFKGISGQQSMEAFHPR